MHDHHHHHHRTATNYGFSFGLGVILNALFVAAEIIGGLAVGSVALLADAGHNAGDVAGLLMAWGASAAGKIPPSPRWTYGFRRSSVLVALVNAGILLISIGAIAVGAIGRLIWPHPVDGTVVMVIAVAGILVNSSSALLFLAGRKRDLNVEAAFLHNAADTAISVAVLIAGLIIRKTHWLWVDPAVGLLIVLFLLRSVWSLLSRSVALALDAVPHGIDPMAVRKHLHQLPGVVAVHDLHIWAMSTTETALTVHVVRPSADGDDSFLMQAAHELHERFGIEHVTIQVERHAAAAHCSQAPEKAV